MPQFRLDGEHRPGEAENLKGRETWHPELFREGEIDFLPFEGDHVIAYRGTAREIFFDYDTSGMMRKDQSSNFSYGSVIKQGFLNPENTYWSESDFQQKSYEKWKQEWMKRAKKEGLPEKKLQKIWDKYIALMRDKSPEKAEQEFEKFLSDLKLSHLKDRLIPEERMNVKKPGVFFGDWNVASYYGRSERNPVILEARMPVSNLSVIVRPPDKDDPASVNKDMEFREAGQIKRKLGRGKFRNLCRLSAEEPGSEIVQYVWRSELSLNHVSGVYDSAISGEKVLMNLSDYVRSLKREEALKMKDIEFLAEKEGQLNQKIYVLNTLEDRLRIILNYLNGLKNGYDKLSEAISLMKSEAGGSWIEKVESNRNQFRKELSLMRRGMVEVQNNLKGKKTPEAEGYNAELDELKDIVRNKLGIQIENREIRTVAEFSQENPGSLITDVKSDITDLEEFLKQERKRSRELSADSRSSQDNIQTKLDYHVHERLSELPDMNALEKNIERSLQADDVLKAVK